jgi:hypothetical protein
MKRATPITASPVSTAKAIAKPIVSRLASDGLSLKRRREYACLAMGDEATGAAGGLSAQRLSVHLWLFAVERSATCDK